MSRIDDLPADRRAVLQLLLKQGKSYDDLSALLRIPPETVRERARDALDRLGPEDGSGLTLERQDEVADYLLGQQGSGQRTDTREFLETSAAGRAWARVVSGELRAVAPDALPEIPAERAPAPQPFETRRGGGGPRRPSAGLRPRRTSRVGGVLLLGAIGAAIAFFVVFVVTGSNDDGTSRPPGTTNPSKTATNAGNPQVLGQVNLNPPAGSSSKALGAVTLVRQDGEVDMLFQAQGLPPNQKGDIYALWVSGPNGAARLGFLRHRVGKSGKARFPAALPTTVDYSKYDEMLLTRETTANPTKPGTVILEGKLPGKL